MPKNTETTVTTNVTVTRDASQMEASLVEERELMRQNLEAEYRLVLDTNAKLLAAGDEHARSEEEILIELNRKSLICMQIMISKYLMLENVILKISLS